jgi:hypothetical protein
MDYKTTWPRVLVVQSRAYQMSVTLPALVAALPLWIRIVSMLATRMSTWWKKSMDTMWVPAVLLNPWVMAAPEYDSKPTPLHAGAGKMLQTHLT